MAKEFDIQGASGLRKQELVFALLQAHSGTTRPYLRGEGYWKRCPMDLVFSGRRTANYLPGPDDIYISPSQIRRFNLRTGDTISGQIGRPRIRSAILPFLKWRASTMRTRKLRVRKSSLTT